MSDGDFKFEEIPLSKLPIEQRGLVEGAVKTLFPIESGFLGPSTLSAVCRGVQFRRVTGGRRVDLTAAIGIASGAASLVQISIQIINWLKNRNRDAVDSGEFKKILREQLTESAILAELLARDPETLDKLFRFLMRNRE
jgi:hypothetical protein